MAINRAFGDPDLAPNNFSSFSEQEISADSEARGLEQLEPIPPVRSTTPMELSSVIGADLAQKIQNAGKITFHTVGHTGGIHNPEFQFAVADAMADDERPCQIAESEVEVERRENRAALASIHR